MQRVGAVDKPLALSGAVLVAGAGAAGALNAAFSLVVIRVDGISAFSAVSPLLGLGSIAASASVGIEYAAVTSIVRSGSFRCLRRQAIGLVGPSAALFIAAPLVGGFLRIWVPFALLAVLLAVATLFAALPTAMLIAEGLYIPLVLIAVAEAVLRSGLLLAMGSVAPILTSVGASIGVTVLGGLAMAGYAWQHRAPVLVPLASNGEPGPPQLASSAMAFGLALPFAAPAWLARHLLAPGPAGVVALAALLGGAVMSFAGPITSAMVPRIATDAPHRDIRRGAALCAAFALVAAVGTVALGPLVLPYLTGRATPGLRGELAVLALGGVLWAMVAYVAWVRTLRGAPAYRFAGAALVAAAAQLAAGFLVQGPLSFAAGPLIAAAIFSLAFTVRDRLTHPVVDLSGLEHVQVPVSVGMMAHNEQELIVKSLTAFLHQRSTWSVVTEIVVIVSGSTDGTEVRVRRLAAEDPRVKLVVEPVRTGKVVAVTQFLAMACHDICVVASADVVPAHDCVDNLVRPMLGEASVGMTGPTVLSLYRPGLVPAMHRMLWALHNRLNHTGRLPKLGEIVAVRRGLVHVDPIAGCDEVLLEASVTTSGYQLLFVPEAVVYNVAPTSVKEYLVQRRRIHAQHVTTAGTLGYRAASMNVYRGLIALVQEVRSRPQTVPVAIACIAAELVGRITGRLDARRGMSMTRWEQSRSAHVGVERRVALPSALGATDSGPRE